MLPDGEDGRGWERERAEGVNNRDGQTPGFFPQQILHQATFVENLLYRQVRPTKAKTNRA